MTLIYSANSSTSDADICGACAAVGGASAIAIAFVGSLLSAGRSVGDSTLIRGEFVMLLQLLSPLRPSLIIQRSGTAAVFLNSIYTLGSQMMEVR